MVLSDSTQMKAFLIDQGAIAGIAPVSSRDMGRHLQGCMVNGRDALSQLKQRHAGLRHFFTSFPDVFQIEYRDDSSGSAVEQRASRWHEPRLGTHGACMCMCACVGGV